MSKVLGVTPPFAHVIRQKLGRPGGLVSSSEFGSAVFGDVYLGYVADSPSYGFYGIYQMRKCKEGKIPILMKFYSPSNPQTEDQQANRSNFANAVSGWQGLSESEKMSYNESAKFLNMSGYNLYIRRYMLSLE